VVFTYALAPRTRQLTYWTRWRLRTSQSTFSGRPASSFTFATDVDYSCKYVIDVFTTLRFAYFTIDIMRVKLYLCQQCW